METPRSVKRSSRHSCSSWATWNRMIKGANASVPLVTSSSPEPFRRTFRPLPSSRLGFHSEAHNAPARKGKVHSRSRSVPVGAGRTICRYWAIAADTITNVTKTAKRSEEHTSELQSQSNLVCRLLLEKKKTQTHHYTQLDITRSTVHC